MEIWACLQSMFYCLLLLGHVGPAAGSSKWAYLLRSGVCPDRRRAMCTASTRLEMVMQSAFQEIFSYTMAVQAFLDGGSVMVSRMRAVALASVLGRGGVPVAVAAVFANSSPASLPL